MVQGKTKKTTLTLNPKLDSLFKKKSTKNSQKVLIHKKKLNYPQNFNSSTFYSLK